MRLIHLCFQLHLPRQTREADLAARFKEANEQIYQPFLALLERNTQRYAAWHFSVLVSGDWLELAEKYDRDLIERLKKLLKTGRIELINEPFYHSLAFFYNKDELARQVKLYQDKVRDLFGFEGQIFAMPDFIYNNGVGKWAEEFGFAGMLVGGGERVLDFRSANHVYEAAGCEYLRLLFQNRHLVKQVEDASDELLTETERDGEKKIVLSAKKFQKKLDLECLRGNLVNLYFDAGIVKRQREKSVISFFDKLIENWLETKGNKFVNAKEACVTEVPTAEVDVRGTVDWREDTEGEGGDDAMAVVLAKETQYRLPKRLSGKVQEEFGRKLYALGKEVVSTEDEALLAEFRQWTVMDLQESLRAGDMADWEKEFARLKEKADEAKKKQAVEISQAYTKKRDRGLDEASEVKVNFGKKKAEREVVDAGVVGVEAESETESEPEEVRIEVVPTKIVVDEPEIELPENGGTRKPRRIKKIIKKLVIE